MTICLLFIGKMGSVPVDYETGYSVEICDDDDLLEKYDIIVYTSGTDNLVIESDCKRLVCNNGGYSVEHGVNGDDKPFFLLRYTGRYDYGYPVDYDTIRKYLSTKGYLSSVTTRGAFEFNKRS